MNKKILSVLLCGSLLFETVFANAVSISFEDLERSNKTLDLEQAETSSLEEDESNIYFEELEEPQFSEEIETVPENNILETDSYIDEYYFPEATDENIQTLSLDSGTELEYSTSRQTNSMIAYFSEAEQLYIESSNRE